MSERAYEGKLVSVEIRDGKELVVHGAVVAVVAVDRDDRVVLVRQYRVGANGPLLKLPAGNVDDGEQPLAAARREVREETGLRGGDWTEVASVYSSPGFCDERVHLFVARGLDEGEPDPDGGEDVEVVRVAVADVPALLADVEDAKTLAGLLLYLRLHG